MPIIARSSGGGDYLPASAGTHAAVCVDVIDQGLMESSFTPGKKEPKVSIVWQIDEDRKDGKPFEVRLQFTLSVHEKASLRAALESWRGKGLTPEEIENGFDVERLLGAPAFLNLVHKVAKNGKTYANVAAIMPLPKGMNAPAVRNYVRVCDRDPSESEAVLPEEAYVSDDQVPF
jgi:hypothetical protein